MQKTILFIDENSAQRRAYKKRIQDAYGDEVKVEAIPPEENISKTLSIISSMNIKLVSLFLDEILNEKDSDFYGTEFAREYRLLDQMIPIYILTSYPDGLDFEGGDYEYIIEKTSIRDGFSESWKKRFRRHINQYKQIMSERHTKINDLIQKSITSELNCDEREELSKLILWKEKPIRIEENEMNIRLTNELDIASNLLNQIKQEIQKIEK